MYSKINLYKKFKRGYCLTDPGKNFEPLKKCNQFILHYVGLTPLRTSATQTNIKFGIVGSKTQVKASLRQVCHSHGLPKIQKKYFTI